MGIKRGNVWLKPSELSELYLEGMFGCSHQEETHNRVCFVGATYNSGNYKKERMVGAIDRRVSIPIYLYYM